MPPPTPKVDIGRSPLSLFLKFLRISIVAFSLTLLAFSVTYLTTSIPPAQVFFLFAIPLLWILPIYFTIAFVSPILLLCRSTYGQRPTWLSPKERYVALALPAFVTFALAIYHLIATVNNGSFDYLQWIVLPYLCLALSSLAYIEAFSTYRLDKQFSLHQQAPPPATCGKLFCLHKCVSFMAHRTPSGTPVDSTFCSSVRLIRNISAFGAIVGAVVLLNIIALFLPIHQKATLSQYIITSDWSAITAHVLFVFFWMGFIFAADRPLTSFPARFKGSYLSVFLALLLLIWTVFNASESLDNDCRGGFCTFWVGYAFWGALFSVLAVGFHILVIVFSWRRYNTTATDADSLDTLQKYEQPSQQLGRSSDVIVEMANKNVDHYPLSDGKIEG